MQYKAYLRHWEVNYPTHNWMPSPFKFGRKKTAHPQQAVPPSVILQAIPTPSTSMPFPDQNSNESAVRPVAAPASTLSADSPSLISAEKKKAGMNFLKTLLNVVSKAPVLGIGVATEAILRIIKGLEVKYQDYTASL